MNKYLNTMHKEKRLMTWEEQVQWVMKNTDVEWENLYIVEEIAKETTPKYIITIQVGEEIFIAYE
jgi:cell division protein FtsL